MTFTVVQKELIALLLEAQVAHALAYNEEKGNDEARGGQQAPCEERQRENFLRALDFILGDHEHLLDHCMDVIDSATACQKSIRKLISNTTGRSFWKVPSTNTNKSMQRQNEYICTSSYCSCKSFTELAKGISDDGLICKHLLAVQVATALGLIEEEAISDDKFANELCGQETCG